MCNSVQSEDRSLERCIEGRDCVGVEHMSANIGNFAAAQETMGGSFVDAHIRNLVPFGWGIADLVLSVHDVENLEAELQQKCQVIDQMIDRMIEHSKHSQQPRGN